MAYLLGLRVQHNERFNTSHLKTITCISFLYTRYEIFYFCMKNVLVKFCTYHTNYALFTSNLSVQIFNIKELR